MLVSFFLWGYFLPKISSIGFSATKILRLGLPLGVQLVGNKLDDLRFLGTANWLEKNCKDE